jgi:hypothetical protein
MVPKNFFFHSVIIKKVKRKKEKEKEKKKLEAIMLFSLYLGYLFLWKNK